MTRHWRYLMGVLAASFLLLSQANAGVITLGYIAAATAVDYGPQDGIFDAFTPSNFGSVNNNGYISLRTSAEFPLAGIPAGTAITSAELAVTVANFGGTRGFAVNGYPGDGTITLADFARNDLLGTATVGIGTTTLAFNVTNFITGLQGQGNRFAGLNFRESPANTSNFVIMNMVMTDGNAPRLTIDYRTVPDPSTVALLLAGMGGFAGVRRRIHNVRTVLQTDSEPEFIDC